MSRDAGQHKEELVLQVIAKLRKHPKTDQMQEFQTQSFWTFSQLVGKGLSISNFSLNLVILDPPSPPVSQN